MTTKEPTNKELVDVINLYLTTYGSYEDDVQDLIEFCRFQEDKARVLVLKRYPQLQVN
jgi:hypothetical protein